MAVRDAHQRCRCCMLDRTSSFKLFGAGAMPLILFCLPLLHVPSSLSARL